MFGLALLFWPGRALHSDNFVFYFPSTRQVLPVEVIQGSKYLPLLQILNLLGRISGLQEKRGTLKIWFGNSQLEFRQDDSKVRVDKVSFKLAEPVRVSNGQWVVPLDFLTSVLPRLTHQVVEYQVGTSRIFIGDVKPCSFTVRLDDVGNGARLTVQFTDKVTVKTASMNGKWVLFLGDRPVEPLESVYHFQDRYLTELRFDDQDGTPKLVLTPGVDGLNFYPVLAEGGKVLLADVLKPPPVVAQQTPSPAPPAVPGQAPPAGTQAPLGPTGETPAAPPGPPLPVVVLDAGHGGEDSGGRSREGVLEKDLVAQLVARVRLALLSSQKFRVMLTRTGDVNPSFEERTTTANLAGAVAFLTFHAGDSNTSPHLAVYVYEPPAPAALAPGDEAPRPLFLPWVSLQEAHLEQSRQLAVALQEQFAHLAGATTDAPQAAPVRALRSVNASAVAVEIGRLAPDADAGPVINPDFLQRLSNAVAQGVLGFTGKGS